MAVKRDDPFAGGVAPRLLRIDRELAAAVLDAQCRDWAAERPDRVGFARLGQARHEVFTAARRYRAVRFPVDWLPPALVGAVVFLVLRSDEPLPLAGAAVAGLWSALAVVAGPALIRRRRARRGRAGPAPIDDPYLYAGLRRRIETCALAARGDPSSSEEPTS
jgi:hypothetical protein